MAELFGLDQFDALLGERIGEMMADPRNVPGVAAAHPQIRLIVIERLADGAACSRPHDFLLLLGEPLARLHLRLKKREDRVVVWVRLVVRDTGQRPGDVRLFGTLLIQPHHPLSAYGPDKTVERQDCIYNGWAASAGSACLTPRTRHSNRDWGRPSWGGGVVGSTALL